MRDISQGLTIVAVVMLPLCAGCDTPQPTVDSAVMAAPAPPPGIEAPQVRDVDAVPVSLARRDSRVIEDDQDGDGIVDYRVLITEEFDDTGTLMSRLREQDFDADGIVDARTVTRLTGDQ